MRRLFFAGSAVSLLTLALGACGETYSAQATFVRTSTVPLGQETAFLVDSPVRVTLIGQPRSSDLVYHLEGTITASTTTVAQGLADEIEVETEAPDVRTTQLVIRGTDFDDGTISAHLRIWVPEDMDVGVVARNGTLDIVDIGGDIDALSASHGKIVGATGSVELGVDRGNAIAEVSALPGSTISVATNTGDVQVILPPRPSVALSAQTNQGAILVRHPQLPAYPGGGLPYGVQVNGGLSQVTLTAGIGNVVIDSQ